MTHHFLPPPHRHCAAELLAFTVQKLFPKALLVGGGITSYGFYYDFLGLPEEIESFFPTIDQQLHQARKDDLPIEKKEMMRENAADFLIHSGHPLRAKKALEEKKNVVSLISMGSFVDLYSAHSLGHVEEIGALRLLECEQRPSEEGVVTRLSGVVFASSKECKQFIKEWAEAKKWDSTAWAAQQQLFALSGAGSPIWDDRGLQWKQFFQSFWENAFPSPPWQQIQTPLSDFFPLPGRFPHSANRFREWKRALCQGRESEHGWTVVVGNRDEISKELISSLQFIEKTSTIFGVGLHWFLSSNGRETGEERRKRGAEYKSFRSAFQELGLSYREDGPESPFSNENGSVTAFSLLADELGREFPGPSITWKPEAKTTVCLLSSLFGPIDQWMTFLIERWRGVFPLWMAPEQLRILPATPTTVALAQQALRECKERGVRATIDFRECPLKTRVHGAAIDSVPWVAVIGDREQQSGTLTFRETTPGEPEQKQMTLDEWRRTVVQLPSETNYEESH